MVGVVGGMAVGLIVVMVLGIVFFRRTVRSLPALREQWKEIYEQKGDAIRRWNRWGCVVQFVYASLVVLLVVSGRMDAFALAVILLSLIIPLSFIMEGLRILTLGYAEVRPVLNPLYYVTGEKAAQQGKVTLTKGMLLLIPWFWFVAYVLRWLGLI
jgi:hypothetical protein